MAARGPFDYRAIFTGTAVVLLAGFIAAAITLERRVALIEERLKHLPPESLVLRIDRLEEKGSDSPGLVLRVEKLERREE